VTSRLTPNYNSTTLAGSDTATDRASLSPFPALESWTVLVAFASAKQAAGILPNDVMCASSLAILIKIILAWHVPVNREWHPCFDVE
jgi:hypothetical protein